MPVSTSDTLEKEGDRIRFFKVFFIKHHIASIAYGDITFHFPPLIIGTPIETEL